MGIRWLCSIKNLNSLVTNVKYAVSYPLTTFHLRIQQNMVSIKQYQTLLSKWWNYLTGDSTSFSVENRLFNTISVITLAGLLVFTIANAILGLPVIHLIITTLALQAVLYYFSRFKKAYRVPAIIYCFATYVFLVINYYFNAGITGPTLFGFIGSYILIAALGPIHWHRFWITLHIVLVCGLLALEYFNTGTYRQYETRLDHFTDVGITYIITVAIMYFIIQYVRNNYIKEKLLAEKYAASILKKNKELEELHQVKNRLFSIISHDLRSPLNSIQGYLEVLNDNAFTEVEKSKIQGQLLHLTRHTQDMLFNLLSWSKSQLSGNNIELRPVNVFDTINETLIMLQSAASKKDITLNNLINPGVTVKGNADMLQLVVRNLVHNAIKFTRNGGTIWVDTYWKESEGFVSIRDNGVGIPVEKQAEIFSSKLVSEFGTNKEKGIGLGLHLCRELTELQGGKIWFTSKPGEGSVFTISLPIC